MNTNIIVAQFKNGQKKAVTHPAWFIDHGMVLSIEGLELPMAFEAHFSNSRNSAAATRVIGHEGQVEIPDELFTSGAPIIYCWVYLHPAAWIGLTKYEITIPLQQRANVEPPEPTAEQVDIIDQAISALNDGVAEARAQAENASSSASSAASSASEASQSATSASSSASSAANSASEASESAVSASSSASSAANSAFEASQSADRAEQAAAQSGYLWFYIEAGRLYMDRTQNTQVDFYVQDGKLYVEEIA